MGFVQDRFYDFDVEVFYLLEHLNQITQLKFELFQGGCHLAAQYSCVAQKLAKPFRVTRWVAVNINSGDCIDDIGSKRGFVSFKKLMKSSKANLVLSRLILLAICSGRFWLINQFLMILTQPASWALIFAAQLISSTANPNRKSCTGT